MTESHVVVDQGKNLRGVVIRKTEVPTNFFCHLHAHVHMAVESDAIRRDAKGRRLAHIMQERTPRQSRRARLRQIFQQQQGMNKDVAFGMKLRRLLNAFHR